MVLCLKTRESRSLPSLVRRFFYFRILLCLPSCLRVLRFRASRSAATLQCGSRNAAHPAQPSEFDQLIYLSFPRRRESILKKHSLTAAGWGGFRAYETCDEAFWLP